MCSGSASGQRGHERQRGGVAAVALAYLGGSGDEEVLDLLDGCGAGFDGAATGGQQGFECIGVGVFGDGWAVAGQRGAGGTVGIERVGFSLPAPGCPVGSVDFNDVNSVGLQCLCESGAVAAGALDSCGDDVTKAAGPADRGPVAGGVGAEFGVAERLAGVGDGGDVDGVQMGVGADDDSAWGCHDGGVLSVVMNRAGG